VACTVTPKNRRKPKVKATMRKTKQQKEGFWRLSPQWIPSTMQQ